MLSFLSSGLIWAELDTVLHKPSLNLFGEKLHFAVGLAPETAAPQIPYPENQASCPLL